MARSVLIALCIHPLSLLGCDYLTGAKFDRAYARDEAPDAGTAVEATLPDAGAPQTGELGDRYEDLVSFVAVASPHSTVVSVYAGVGGRDACVRQVLDACVVTLCPANASAQPEGAPLDIGPVVVANGASDVRLAFDARTQSYPVLRLDYPLWHAGDAVRAVAPGNPEGLGALKLEADAPSAIRFGCPDIASKALTIDTKRDLDVCWEGGTTGLVEVGVAREVVEESLQQYRSSLHVGCDFPAKDGHGVIPTALLALLPKGEAPKGESNFFGGYAVSHPGLDFSVRTSPRPRWAHIATVGSEPYFTRSVIFE